MVNSIQVYDGDGVKPREPKKGEFTRATIKVTSPTGNRLTGGADLCLTFQPNQLAIKTQDHAFGMFFQGSYDNRSAFALTVAQLGGIKYTDCKVISLNIGRRIEIDDLEYEVVITHEGVVG